MPFWIIGALAAPFTWFIGRDAGFDARPALAASLMVAVPGGLTPFMSQTGQLRTLHDPWRAGPVAVRPWSSRGSPCIRARRARGRAGDAWPDRTACCSAFRLQSSACASSFAGCAVGRSCLSATAVVGCAALFAIVMVPWTYPPDGGLRLVPSVGQQRPTVLADRLPAAVQHCQPTNCRRLARAGDRRDRRQPRGWPRLLAGPVCDAAAGRCSGAVRAHWRVDTSTRRGLHARSSSMPWRCSRSWRWCSRCSCRTARSSMPRPRSCRTRSCWSWPGSARPSAGSPGEDRPGMGRGPPSSFRTARSCWSFSRPQSRRLPR